MAHVTGAQIPPGVKTPRHSGLFRHDWKQCPDTKRVNESAVDKFVQIDTEETARSERNSDLLLGHRDGAEGNLEGAGAAGGGVIDSGAQVNIAWGRVNIEVEGNT